MISYDLIKQYCVIGSSRDMMFVGCITIVASMSFVITIITLICTYQRGRPEPRADRRAPVSGAAPHDALGAVIYVSLYMNICIYVYVYTYVFIYIYIYIYMCIIAIYLSTRTVRTSLAMRFLARTR